MGLTPQQRRVLATIKAVANKKNATPKQVKAAIETGLVESNLTNPSGGDRDSAGWRQERASLYRDPTDLRASVARFFDETARVRGQYGSAGELAAAVQRPAAQFRGRYQQQSARADQLLGRAGAGGAFGQAGAARTVSTTKTVGAVDNRAARGALIAAFVKGGDPRLTSGSKAQGLETTDPLAFAQGIAGLKDNPGRKVTTTRTVSTGPGTVFPGGRVRGSKAGDPVAHGTSVGGTHPTAGLAGYPAKDYFAPAGSAAVAPVAGRIVRFSGHDPKAGPTNGPHGPLGYSIYLQGNDGRTYFLTHLGSRTVTVGQTVRPGQKIGTVANYDKYGTPSHIHMGVSS